MFTVFRNIVSFVSMNTTVIVINNFVDTKDLWAYSSEEIQRNCQSIIAETNKCIEFWNIDACIARKYGLRVLFRIL